MVGHMMPFSRGPVRLANMWIECLMSIDASPTRPG